MDKVKHVLIGARANLAPNLASNGIARQRATITGLLGTITDITANPTVSKAGWTKPVAVSKENTEMTIHGWAAVAESLAINFGNTVTPSFLIGDELVGITNMSATGTAVVRATPLAPMLEDVHERLAGVVIENLDWLAFIDRYDRPGALFYLDPPYFGSEGDYGAGLFSRDQFEVMAERLERLKGSFLLSINDAAETRQIFSRFETVGADLHYSVAGGKGVAARELIVRS